MIDNDTITQTLSAVADPTRLKIVLLLSEHNRLNVTAIAQQFNISRPTISHHLKILKDAKVARREQVGQEVYYWLDRTHVAHILRSMADLVEDCRARAE